MNIQRVVLFKSLVTPFYRRNAGLLCFIFFIMFFGVGRANGVGLLEYHYSLIRGMMLYPSFLITVMFIWLIYAIKCVWFVFHTLRKPAFSYLYLLSQENKGKVYLLLLLVQCTLYIPVFSYLVFILKTGYSAHWYLPTNLSLLFNLVVCVVCAGIYLYYLQRPGRATNRPARQFPVLPKRRYYSFFLLGYVIQKDKFLLLAIKVCNCVILYLVLNNRQPARDHDIRLLAMLYCIGMLAHGVLVHRLKEHENTRLNFYRQLPIPTLKRFAAYAWFYFVLFIPELAVIATHTPYNLFYSEACFFVFFGYSLLLLLNSLQLFNYTGLMDYLKTVSQAFFAVIIAMIPGKLYMLSVLFFLSAVIIFFRRYYRFDPGQNRDDEVIGQQPV